MQEQHYLPLPPEERSPTKLRDFVAVLFRHRRVLVISFFATLLAGVIAGFLAPHEYSAQAKLLVKRDRYDPVVTAESGVQQRAARTMTEQEVNSEVDLLKSRDLLQKVVLETGLHERKSESLLQFLEDDDPQARMAEAVDKLEENLETEPPNKSNLIRITYRSSDPQLAAKVLNTLSSLYLEKHLAVHRAPGTYEVFKKEAEKYHNRLLELQKKLADFNDKERLISAVAEKDSSMLKLADFQASLDETRAAISATQQRIQALREQAASTPKRTVTEVRSPAGLIESLKTALFTQEQKRTELLQKFAPDYRGVKDIEKQIADTKAAIAQAEAKPVQEETTDGNPTYHWIDSELAKATSELAAQQARARTTERIVRSYRNRALDLEKKGITQQQLLRAAKEAEDNYLLYSKKQEESRMSAALDQSRILNVAIAEAATVPSFPASSASTKLLLAFLLAILVSLGLVFVVDFFDPSFRSPTELAELTGLRVFAAIPVAPYSLATADAEESGKDPAMSTSA